MARFIIKITETVTEKITKGHDWETLSESDGNKEYGYTPEYESTSEIERTILLQNKEELDLNAVIRAINGL